MATEPIGPNNSAVTLPGTFPPMPAVARILSTHSRERLEAFVSVAIDLMDVADGDPDLESATDVEDDFALSSLAVESETGPGCSVSDPKEHGGDEADTGYTEWHTRGRHKDNPGITDREGWPLHEDAEEDDPAGIHDEDGCNTLMSFKGSGPGCMISDSDYCLAGDDRITSGSVTALGGINPDAGPGDADDAELWQMTEHVPMDPVFSVEHNIFNDQRTRLGRSNLMTSFRTNGGEERSADSGAILVTLADGSERQPGSPV